MEPTLPFFTTDPSPTELEQVRSALKVRFPHGRNIFGAQLGEVIRRHLTNPDLKTRFGGLKNFVTRYLPTEIIWRGKKGLDDLYDVMVEEADKNNEPWRQVTSGASAWLWAAVTNPSTLLQFAWSPTERTLMTASIGVPLPENLSAVEKLTNEDYRQIAKAFVGTRESTDAGPFLKALESASSMEFTALIRQRSLLPKWEEFRVNSALRLFAERLTAAGAEAATSAHWVGMLRSSQSLARAERLHKHTSLIEKSQPILDHLAGTDKIPEMRAVAIRALEYLSDAELSELKFSLGPVMKAFRSLFKA